MKKIITAILLLGLVMSCGPTKKELSQPQQPRDSVLIITNKYQNFNKNVTEYWLEGCQYIRVDYGNTCWGSHKGNCKNPIHIYNK